MRRSSCPVIFNAGDVGIWEQTSPATRRNLVGGLLKPRFHSGSAGVVAANSANKLMLLCR